MSDQQIIASTPPGGASEPSAPVVTSGAVLGPQVPSPSEWRRRMAPYFAAAVHGHAQSEVAGLTASDRPTFSGLDVRRAGFEETYASPGIDEGHQGYTWTGTHHVIFHTTAIHKYDANWNLVQSNATPFAGLTGYNHLGDGTHYGGKLYIPAQTYSASGGSWSNPAVMVFDATTLSREAVYDVSAQNFEISACCVDGALGELYAVTFTRATSIWKYRLSDMAYLGKITLDASIQWIQGVSKKDGLFWMLQDVNGHVFIADANGRTALFHTISGYSANYEGCEWVGDEFRWLSDIPGATPERRIHYMKFAPSASSALKTDPFGNTVLKSVVIQTASDSAATVIDIYNASDSPSAGAAINIHQGSSNLLAGQLVIGYGSGGFYIALKVFGTEALRVENKRVKFNGITHWGRVAALPASGMSIGDLCTLTADQKTYAYGNSAWNPLW